LPIEDPFANVARKLDQVVGKRFEEPRPGRVRRTLLKWFVGAACAVSAAATIVIVIETHRMPRDMPRPASKPVTVKIVPAPAESR
jgi:hypothetical protein